MKFHIQFTLLIFVCLCVQNTNAQDIIVKRDSLKINCKIEKVEATEVSYFRFENATGPLYKIGRNKIAYIIYQNGSRDYLGLAPSSDVNSEELGVLCNSVRFNLYGPVMNYASAEYERHLKKQMALTVEGGIIGVNSSSYDYNYDGGLIALGLRVYDPRYKRPNRLFKSNLKFGAYALGKIHFETFSADESESDFADDSNYDFSNTSAGISFGGGITLHFLKYLQLDLHSSIGYFLLHNHKPAEPLELGQERERLYSFSLFPLQSESKFAGEISFSLGFNF